MYFLLKIRLFENSEEKKMKEFYHFVLYVFVVICIFVLFVDICCFVCFCCFCLFVGIVWKKFVETGRPGGKPLWPWGEKGNESESLKESDFLIF